MCIDASKEFLNLLVNDEAVYKAVQILKLFIFHKSEADTKKYTMSDRS